MRIRCYWSCICNASSSARSSSSAEVTLVLPADSANFFAYVPCFQAVHVFTCVQTQQVMTVMRREPTNEGMQAHTLLWHGQHASTHTRPESPQVQLMTLRLRMIKSNVPLTLDTDATAGRQVASAAHVEVMRKCRPGLMEYALEALFLRDCYLLGGCRHAPYTPICASGPNAAVLHYGHAAAPNSALASTRGCLPGREQLGDPPSVAAALAEALELCGWNANSGQRVVLRLLCGSAAVTKPVTAQLPDVIG